VSYPETVPAQRWVLSNERAIKDYPIGMAFLVPTAARNAPFDSMALGTDLLLGLRSRMMPADFLNQFQVLLGDQIASLVGTQRTTPSPRAS
jgi:hypothetical protein